MNKKLYVAHVGDSTVVIGERVAKRRDGKLNAKCITEVCVLRTLQIKLNFVYLFCVLFDCVEVGIPDTSGKFSCNSCCATGYVVILIINECS